jgi:hypothetical protein
MNMSYSPTLGRWIQTDPEGYVDGLNLQEYVRSNPVGMVDPAGTAAQATGQPTTQPTMQQVAQQQLAALKAAGKKFAQQDAAWSWSNQCDVQAADLQAALLSDPQWKNTKPKLWKIDTTGGTGSWRFGRHNVVLLTPINGNPLPPMILDSFHGPQTPFSGRDCKCKSLKRFKNEYPDPVDADAWWKVVLKNLPKDV